MSHHDHGPEKKASDLGAQASITVGAPPVPDAGMRDLDHYASRLPQWRYAIRQRLIPIIRWETPYLAYMQEKLRTPALDSYFAIMANLGTHTFFMIMLPILFWCGYTNVGRVMVDVLADGVFWSGFVKDMLCLPRPLSPPLQRITMSGSAALEYGFPSTHSTNAVSVTVYAIHKLQESAEGRPPWLHTTLQCLFYFYAVSIVFGRLYCGMHGFFDVVIGSALGAIIAYLRLWYGEAFYIWLCHGPYINILIAVFVVLILVRIHPEPADDCPCFDDSVSFEGVVIGCQIGAWHYASTAFSIQSPVPGTVPFDLKNIGLLKAALRIVLGVLIVFAWREVAKPLLLRGLPPLFRVLERIRVNMPRKFFLKASQYSKVPTLRKDDNVIPSASDIPQMLNNLRHPRRRSVSIGPQSMADAYETLAYRQQRRRESLSRMDGSIPEGSTIRNRSLERESNEPQKQQSGERPVGVNYLPPRASSRVRSYEKMMGAGDSTSPENDPADEAFETSSVMTEAEKEDREIFLKLEKPRVRYDVEVVTKLIVYSGIGWLAVEINPILFELCGLGMGKHG